MRSGMYLAAGLAACAMAASAQAAVLNANQPYSGSSEVVIGTTIGTPPANDLQVGDAGIDAAFSSTNYNVGDYTSTTNASKAYTERMYILAFQADATFAAEANQPGSTLTLTVATGSGSATAPGAIAVHLIGFGTPVIDPLATSMNNTDATALLQTSPAHTLGTLPTTQFAVTAMPSFSAASLVGIAAGDAIYFAFDSEADFSVAAGQQLRILDDSTSTTLTVTPVPEPTALSLLALSSVVALTRRQKH